MKPIVLRWLRIFYQLKLYLFVKCLLVNSDRTIWSMLGRMMSFSWTFSYTALGYLSSALWRIPGHHLHLPQSLHYQHPVKLRCLLLINSTLGEIQNMRVINLSERRLGTTWSMTRGPDLNVICVLQHTKRLSLVMDFEATCKFTCSSVIQLLSCSFFLERMRISWQMQIWITTKIRVWDPMQLQSLTIRATFEAWFNFNTVITCPGPPHWPLLKLTFMSTAQDCHSDDSDVWFHLEWWPQPWPWHPSQLFIQII